MPSSMNIGLLVFGAVLVLLSLVVGKFKIFGAEIEGTVGKAGRVIAFILGVALVVASVSLGRNSSVAPSQPNTQDPAHTVYVAPPTPYMGELQYGINFQGGDIVNIIKPEVNTAGECSNVCLQNSRCKSMTFVVIPSGGGVCWLKDTVPQSSPATNMVSAVKVIPSS